MFSSGPQSTTAYPQAPNQSTNGAVATGQYVPEPQDKPKAPPKSKAGGDIGAFIQQCIALCAYLKELETQSHLIHLNYEGSNFLGVHAFLKDQYKTHLKQFDTLAEFVRSMDYLMPMCGCGLKDMAPPMQAVKSYKGTDMLGVYYKNLEELGMKAKKLEPVAAKVGAIDIQNYMADLVGQAFKAAWQVKATLRSS
jgi:DNA-binding ferritin-like protein